MIKSFIKKPQITVSPVIASSFAVLNEYLGGGFQENCHYLMIGKFNYFRDFVIKLGLVEVEEVKEAELVELENTNIIVLQETIKRMGIAFSLVHYRLSNNAVITFLFVLREVGNQDVLANFSKNTNFERVVGIYSNKSFYVLNHSGRWFDFDQKL